MEDNKEIKQGTAFKFWMPADLEKAKDEKTGKTKMMVKGIASTVDRDTDGEVLDPEGFDLDYFKSFACVNWHHQAKFSPKAIIGEPTKAEIQKGKGLYVECELYSESELAREVYELAETLEKNSKTRRLGFSIEGRAVERDPMDETKVTKAIITGLAITHMPKNPATLCDIMKGQADGLNMEWEDIDKKDEEEEDDEKEKSLNTESGAAIKKESVDGGLKDVAGRSDEEEETQGFNKGQVYQKIFSQFPDINIEKAKKVYNLIIKISEMENQDKTPAVTDSSIEKAFAALGLTPEGEPLEKAQHAAGNNAANANGGKTEIMYKANDNGTYSMITKGEDGKEEESEDKYMKKGEEYYKLSKACDYAEKGDKKYVVEKGEDGKYAMSDDEYVEKSEQPELEKAQENELEKAAAAPAEGKTDVKDMIAQLGSTISASIEKGMGAMRTHTDEQFKNVGTILGNINARLEAVEGSGEGRRSLSSVKSIEKSFDENLSNNGGQPQNDGKTRLSLSQNKNEVKSTLNALTFEKGEINEFYGDALQLFEASGQMQDTVIRALDQKNIVITK